ncbi:DUF6479 family protein [Streptomyces spororaveus]|uniref:DUF6479 family protein n=1 Tax=Streptomyces spororaveus TaxID=284039 RepID=UPI00379544B8
MAARILTDQPSLFLIAAGVVLVVLLIGAFLYGSRRRRRATDRVRRPPVRPGDCLAWLG